MIFWTPSSSTLRNKDGIWRPDQISTVSYPGDGNNICFSIEETSYWFAHRNACILALLSQFPPDGEVYDIGGGNGYVSLALNKAGIDSVLVEPGHGAHNAVSRGMTRVIQAALEDTGFTEGSLPAAGVFDVVEHIDEDVAFMRSVQRLLRPGGRFYGTVPAFQALWSGDDVHAGHFRRHDREGIASRLRAAGFEVEFAAYFFSWLVLPVFLFRSLPFRFRGTPTKPSLDSAKRDHSLPGFLGGVVNQFHDWELDLLRHRRSPAGGSSLLFCARKPRA
jgi:SAM-dependent methyltransferase